MGYQPLPQKHLLFSNPTKSVRFFSEAPKYQNFSSLTPSYLLKVTEFLGMIQKNVCADKLFLSLNISDFNLLFMWQLQPPWKKSPPLSHQPPSPPLKVEVLSSLPFFKNLVGGLTLPCSRTGEGGGGHSGHYIKLNIITKMDIIVHFFVNRIIWILITGGYLTLFKWSAKTLFYWKVLFFNKDGLKVSLVFYCFLQHS